MILRVLASIVLYFGFSQQISVAESHSYLSECYLVSKETIIINEREIELSLFYQRGFHFNEYFSHNNLLDRFEYFSKKYMLEFSPKDLSCSSDKVSLYIMKKSTLNDRSIFDNWYSTGGYEGQASGTLIGLTRVRNGVSEIYISDYRVDYNKPLSHEISHFLYRKSCENISDKYKDESRALYFQKKYAGEY